MDVKKIIDEIKEKNQFSQITIEEFAPEEGWANSIAKELKDKRRQLRKVFAQIKDIEKKIKKMNEQDELNEPKIFLILPQVAYARGRNLIPVDFYNLIKIIIGTKGKGTKLKKVEDFRRFTDFMTAVVAYSTLYADKK
ncbi:type III-A CRISPR-associated protein Csm2 [Desulfobacca acetoxidans]|uniref:CRISPR system Cms protein Csm2 n=1 Tax=Desulfobacca acetoxidans (strain ATCC 700848 / DSM 11109 / ASRB2) TaxID=880072 RepID=F2NCY8_DESAR|nr:type III-A CRISPR-associated protein Csm2 [Desulfobacca acetoxidans]AEB09562.1 CRISPR-associated protein TM1810 domain protein [Desulfobacca acetoxidans DSM 11109]